MWPSNCIKATKLSYAADVVQYPIFVNLFVEYAMNCKIYCQKHHKSRIHRFTEKG